MDEEWQVGSRMHRGRGQEWGPRGQIPQDGMLEGSREPWKALSRAAMISFLCEKDFSGSVVLRKVDGDKSKGREAGVWLG